MQYKKRIRLGILGAGTVGQSLIKIIEKEQNRILRNHGISIEISKVGDRSFEKKRNIKKIQLYKKFKRSYRR